MTKAPANLECPKALVHYARHKAVVTTITATDEWKRAKNYVVSKYLRILREHGPVERAAFSFEKALYGHKYIPHFEPMDMATSPGLPYKARGYDGAKTKRELLVGENCGKQHLCDTFAYQLVLYIHKASEGYSLRGEFPVMETLKDELREESKVDKPRVFAVNNFCFNVLFRLLYGEFVAHVTNLRNRLSCKVGVNPYDSAQWMHLLGRNRTQFAEHYVAGDYSGFDQMHDAEMLSVFFEIADMWNYTTRPLLSEDLGRIFYGEIDRQPFHVYQSLANALKDVVINTIYLNDGFAYSYSGGNTSGNPATVVINSIINECLMTAAYIALCEEAGYEFSEVESNIITYGDDNVVCLSERDVAFYNQISITEYFEKHNIAYTDAHKGHAVRPTIPLSEVTFLKRSFVPYLTGGCGAPIAIESILNPLFYYQKSSIAHIGRDRPNLTPEALVQQCINSQMRELYLHGYNTFMRYVDRIHRAIREARLDLYLPSYSEVAEQMNELKHNPVDAWVDHDQAVRLANSVRLAIRDNEVAALRDEVEFYDETDYALEGEDYYNPRPPHIMKAYSLEGYDTSEIF